MRKKVINEISYVILSARNKYNTNTIYSCSFSMDGDSCFKNGVK